MRQISLDDILKILDDQARWVIGRTTSVVSTPAPLGRAPVAGGISFCSAPPDSAVTAINETNAEIVVCRADVAKGQLDAAGKTVIGVDYPRRCFIRLVSTLFAPGTEEGIHPTAVIHRDAKLGDGIHIGPLACLGDCSIGDGSIIHGRAHIGDGTVIGHNVIIHPGAVIGTDGFGYERNEDGILERFPHLGNVIVEDNVEIGANSCIDRGTLGDTVIGRGTKIDNLVHIAHNVTIGCDSVITAATMIAGSVTIGASSWIGPASAVNNKMTIGRGSLVGIGSVVVRDVPDDAFVAGVPARRVPNRGDPK